MVGHMVVVSVLVRRFVATQLARDGATDGFLRLPQMRMMLLVMRRQRALLLGRKTTELTDMAVVVLLLMLRADVQAQARRLIGGERADVAYVLGGALVHFAHVRVKRARRLEVLVALGTWRHLRLVVLDLLVRLQRRLAGEWQRADGAQVRDDAVAYHVLAHHRIVRRGEIALGTLYALLPVGDMKLGDVLQGRGKSGLLQTVLARSKAATHDRCLLLGKTLRLAQVIHQVPDGSVLHVGVHDQMNAHRKAHAAVLDATLVRRVRVPAQNRTCTVQCA